MDKQHILSEIKRTALENNGIPLGKRTFFQKTGIKESDWAGRIWPRWSEAVSEAGFTPLVRQAPNDRTKSLSKIVSLTRRLGHLPTVAEMRLEKQNDPDFPGTSSLQRATSREQLLQDLIQYCMTHTGFEDVDHILKTNVVVGPEIDSCEAPEQASQSGTVYLIRAGNHYKIGITAALYRRASQIANGHPNGAVLIHSFDTDDARGIETYWHNRFTAKRVKGKNIAKGEWFALSKSDVDAFRRRKRFI
jgi:Meiotically up-regulated gene 113